MDSTLSYIPDLDVTAHFRNLNLDSNKITNNDNGHIPLGNGNWLPMTSEPRDELYWWSFPPVTKLQCKDKFPEARSVPHAIWKLISGSTVTYLPELLIKHFAPNLFWEVHGRYRDPTAVRVYNFGIGFQGVLEYYTQLMLGIDDAIPFPKEQLLCNLLDIAGFYAN